MTETVNAIIQSLTIAGIIAVIGLIVRLNAKLETMAALIDHPDTGMAARMALIGGRSHKNANEIMANAGKIDAAEHRANAVDARLDRMDARLIKVEDKR